MAVKSDLVVEDRVGQAATATAMTAAREAIAMTAALAIIADQETIAMIVDPVVVDRAAIADPEAIAPEI